MKLSAAYLNTASGPPAYADASEVAKAFAKKYPKRRILKIELASRDSKTEYVIKTRENKKQIEVVFSPEGNIVHGK